MLATSFRTLFACLGIDPVPLDLLAELMALYGGAGRHFHNASHLAHCLTELARSPDAANQAVALALWFHDAIYDPNRHDNEARSAELAVARLNALGLEPSLVRHVAELIHATSHRTTPATSDEQLITDADLSILGQPAAVFDAYERAIRYEYAHVSDTNFRAGRAAILRSFLARSAIYNLPHFRDKYEAQARQNLTRSLAALE